MPPLCSSASIKGLFSLTDFLFSVSACAVDRRPACRSACASPDMGVLEAGVGKVGVIDSQAASNANRNREVASDNASKHLICKAIAPAVLSRVAGGSFL